MDQPKYLTDEIAESWAFQLLRSKIISNNGTVATCMKARTLPCPIMFGTVVTSPLMLSCFFSMENYDPVDDNKTINLAIINLVGDREKQNFLDAMMRTQYQIDISMMDDPWQHALLPQVICRMHVNATISHVDFSNIMYDGLKDIKWS